jgi:SAM-dependent methyltransferase
VIVMDWQAHGLARLAVEPPGPAEVRDRMFFGRWPDTGPGAEILGELNGRRVVELGCGAGHHVAHLVDHHGVIGIGIDSAPAQIQRAKNNYGHLPGIAFTTADATACLADGVEPFDNALSVFGALSFTGPEPLLAAIRRRLTPAGRLVFSVRDDDTEPAAPAWSARLAAAGFVIDTADRLADATVLISARTADP